MRFPQPRLSLHSLLAGFLGILGIVLVVSDWFFVHRLESLNQQHVDRLVKLQKTELAQAYRQFVMRMTNVGEDLAAWDEVVQTLQDSSYYLYWLESRALSTSRTPGYIDAIALYDTTGEVLRETQSDGIPEKLDKNTNHQHLAAIGGEVWLQVVTEVDRNGVLGFVLVQVPLLQGMQSGAAFTRLNPQTVTINIKPGEIIAAEQGLTLMEADWGEMIARPSLRPAVLSTIAQSLGALLLISLAFWQVYRIYVTNPAAKLAEQIDEFDAVQTGRADTQLKKSLPTKELDEIRKSLRGFQMRFQRMQSSLADNNRELWDLAHRDTLTGLLNRRAFETGIQRQRIDESQSALCMLFDCNQFKAINDTYGHGVGDAVLSELATELADCLSGTGVLYRLGGDEFISVIQSCELGEGQHLAEGCAQAVAKIDFQKIGIAEPVRVSVGIAYKAQAERLSITELRRRADIAMYEAKRPGRSAICTYSGELEARGGQHTVSNAALTAVRNVIDNPDCLELHCQPIVTCAEHSVRWQEVLCRARIDGRLIMPGEIFPIIELRRLEPEFDLAVLTALSNVLQQSNGIASSDGISINLAGPSLVNRKVIDVLQSIPSQSQRNYLLEITETALVPHLDQGIAVLETLREAGWEIALDDFGTGYSSLSMLTDLPVDVVKFDRSLVQSLSTQSRQSMVVRRLVELVREAGFQTVAEGVETDEHVSTAKALGFDYLQGFRIERPHAMISI